MTPSEIQKKLNAFLEREVIFCFENVEITGEVVEFLFNKDNIKKIYFIRYEQSTFQKIKNVLLNKDIELIPSLTKDIISNKTVIYCLNNSSYFNPNYALITKERNIKGICFLGFESAFSIKPSSKEMMVVNQQLIDYFQTKKTHSLKINKPDVDKSRICHNRGEEKIKLEQFLATHQERLLVIHGFPGYGKNNLLDELIRKAPNRKYHYFIFQDKLDTYKDIINEIAPYISFIFQQEELKETNILIRSQLVNDFIKRFNENENTTLIFEGLEKVTQDKGNNIEFNSNELTIFFERLITQPNFNPSNKIVFLSRSHFSGNHQIRSYKAEIEIGYLEPFYIKRIMTDEYNRLNRPELAIKIGTYDNYEVIDKATNGHPALALRLVDASFKHGVDEVLNNNEFNDKIGIKIKIEWLLNNYPLEQYERTALEKIGLFNDEIPSDYLRNNFPDSHQIVEQLTSRYLLEARFMKDGSVKYYVPSLIKDYINGITPKEVIRENHLNIGDYFWDKAEDITASSFQKVSFYRKAFHHYNSSDNKEKIKLLVMRFKEKFLIEAWECSRNGEWQDAFFYFNELHINNQIGLANARDYNEFLKVISRMKQKPKNADNLFEEIHSLFLNDSFIAVTYANHLFDKGLYQLCVDECVRIKNVIENRQEHYRADSLSETIIDNTLAKCLFKLNKSNEAKAIISKWKEYFYRKGLNNLNNQEKYHLQSLIMTEYVGLDDFNVYKNTKNNIIKKLEESGVSLRGIPFLQYNLHNTYCLEGEQQIKVEEQFQKTFQIKKDDKLQRSYENFRKNIITTEQLNTYIDQINQAFSQTQLDINLELQSINELIVEGYSLIKELHKIDPRHFQSNYSLTSLMQVEADFYLLKETVRKVIHE